MTASSFEFEEWKERGDLKEGFLQLVEPPGLL